MRDNPLLVQFEQDRQDRKAKKEAKKEAKRLAEEAEKEAAFDKLEVIYLPIILNQLDITVSCKLCFWFLQFDMSLQLHELANNSPESALGGREPDHLLTKATKGSTSPFLC